MGVALVSASVATIFETNPRRLELVRSANEPPTATVEGVVLAGERTWRIDALESLGPRTLLPIANRPLLSYAIGWLTDTTIGATVCSGGDSHRLQDRLRTVHDLRRVEFLDDESPRGPSGCVADVISGAQSDLIVVVEGSVIPTLDLRRLLRTHANSHAAATIVVQPHDDSVDVTSAPDIPAGIYVFNRAVFDHVPEFGYQDIKEGLLRRLYEAGASVRVHQADEWCPRVIDSRSYLAASQWAIRRLSHERGSAVVADPTAHIADDAVLVGPVVIGANVVISEGASIIGPASIGRDSLVQPHAVVSRSMMWERCTVGTGALVDQTILVDGASVEDRNTVMEMVCTAPPAPRPMPTGPSVWRNRLARGIVAVRTTD